MIDTFICGSCQLAFHDIAEFLQHKNACCEETTPQQQQQIQAVLGEDGSISAVLVQSEGEGQPQNALPLEEVQGFSKETTVGAPSEVSVSGGEVVQPLQQQYKTSAGVAEASTDGRTFMNMSYIRQSINYVGDLCQALPTMLLTVKCTHCITKSKHLTL